MKNYKKNSLLVLCKNQQLNPNLELLINKLDNYRIIKISLPLNFKRKLIWFLPWILLYPIFKFKFTAAYVYAKSLILNCKYFMGYSVIPEGIQDISRKCKSFKTIQIQSGYLGEELSTLSRVKASKLKNIDLFLGMSNFQCKLAKKNFAKKVKTVGFLSSEDWIQNNNIVCDIDGFKFDLCLTLNTRNCMSIKYVFELLINYIKNFKDIKLVIALKKRSNFEYLINHCRNFLDYDLLNSKNVSISSYKEDNYSTLKAALASKIIIGVRSSVLYQLGALGSIIYPINIENEFNGNLSNVNLNLNPTQEDFNLNINNLLKEKGRLEYFSNNIKKLRELDDTLYSKKYPSSCLKKEIDLFVKNKSH